MNVDPESSRSNSPATDVPTVFDSPEVGEFLLVISLFPLIAMMEFLPSALCSRVMRFGFITAMGILRAIILAATTVYLAIRGYGYMSFAWGQLLAWLATAVCNRSR